MNTTRKTAALALCLTLAMLCIVGGRGGDAWMVLCDADDGEEGR